MGGGGDGGGMTEEQKYYQDMQLRMQKEAIELQKASLEQSKNSVTEPIKSVEGSMNAASASTVQAAQLRRGIASTFNRPTAFTQANGNATGGSTTKLGN